MRTLLTKLTLAALALALAFTFSCSDDKDDASAPVNMTVRKEKRSGVSQKGPFVEGSTVTLYELNAYLQKTGRTFPGTTDDNGYFEIEVNDLLASSNIILEVNGKYKNEVEGGEESTEPITLKAIADVRNKNTVNINALTDIEYEEVLAGLAQGKTFEDAKTNAQRKVLHLYGIKGSSKPSEDLTLADVELFNVSFILLAYSKNTDELISLLEEAGRINSKVENSDIPMPTIKSLFNTAMNYVLSLYPFANFPDFDDDDLENIIERIRTGGISAWTGDGCDMTSFCMEVKYLTGEEVCNIQSSVGSPVPATPAECPIAARYCLNKNGDACLAIDCPPLIAGLSSSYNETLCINDGGNPNYTYERCRETDKVGTFMHCSSCDNIFNCIGH